MWIIWCHQTVKHYSMTTTLVKSPKVYFGSIIDKSLKCQNTFQNWLQGSPRKPIVLDLARSDHVKFKFRKIWQINFQLFKDTFRIWRPCSCTTSSFDKSKFSSSRGFSASILKNMLLNVRRSRLIVYCQLASFQICKWMRAAVENFNMRPERPYVQTKCRMRVYE